MDVNELSHSLSFSLIHTLTVAKVLYFNTKEVSNDNLNISCHDGKEEQITQVVVDKFKFKFFVPLQFHFFIVNNPPCFFLQIL